MTTATLKNLVISLRDHADTPIYINCGFNRYKIEPPFTLHDGYITINIDCDNVDNPTPIITPEPEEPELPPLMRA